MRLELVKKQSPSREAGWLWLQMMIDNLMAGKVATKEADLGQNWEEEVPKGLRLGLEKTLRRHGYRWMVDETGFLKGVERAATLPKERLVLLSPSLSPAQQTKSLLHECCHVIAGHRYEGKGGQTVEEIDAEGAAFLVAKEQGWDTSSYSGDYLLKKGKQYTAELLRARKSRIMKIADLMKEELQRGNAGREVGF